ncbi:MAG: SAM-dependent methyltransferase [Corynebacterium sp.]|nr:SAM-dependent methyltransferase [Corynebacterium sp.]
MYSPAELDFIITNRQLVEDVIAERMSQGPLTKVSQLADAKFFRDSLQGEDAARAVLELATARANAADKFPIGWLMDHDSAQQATSNQVIAQRGVRIAHAFPQGVVHDVTCSIGTESALMGDGLRYIGSDIDQQRLRMARENNPDAAWFRGDATTMTSNADVIIADPARRSQGRRIARPEDLIPPLPVLLDLYKGRPMAIKCAPGLDFSEWDGVVSVVSVRGGVKEACLYTPEFSFQGESREACVIRADGVDIVTDAIEASVPAAEPGRFILDPDGAIVRAGLVQHFAAREGLWMLDPQIAFLTGERIPTGYSGFEFIQTCSLKKLRPTLKELDAGSAEILVRGVDVDPDKLRKTLKLRGKRAMTVVCTRIGRQGIALICGSRQWSGD